MYYSISLIISIYNDENQAFTQYLLEYRTFLICMYITNFSNG